MVMSGDSFCCHDLEGGATGISWIEARDAVKYTMMYRAAPHNKELSNRKRRRAQGEKSCFRNGSTLHNLGAGEVHHTLKPDPCSRKKKS